MTEFEFQLGNLVLALAGIISGREMHKPETDLALFWDKALEASRLLTPQMKEYKRQKRAIKDLQPTDKQDVGLDGLHSALQAMFPGLKIEMIDMGNQPK